MLPGPLKGARSVSLATRAAWLPRARSVRAFPPPVLASCHPLLMAGPRTDGPAAHTVEAQTQAQIEHYKVAILRDRGLTVDQIAESTGYSQRQIWRILKAIGGDDLAAQHGQYSRAFILGMLKTEVWDRVERALQAMDSSEEGFDKDTLTLALQTIDRMAKVTGAEAPQRSQLLFDAQVSAPEEDEHQAALRAERRRVAIALLRRGGIGQQPPRPEPIDIEALIGEGSR